MFPYSLYVLSSSVGTLAFEKSGITPGFFILQLYRENFFHVAWIVILEATQIFSGDTYSLCFKKFANSSWKLLLEGLFDTVASLVL